MYKQSKEALYLVGLIYKSDRDLGDKRTLGYNLVVVPGLRSPINHLADDVFTRCSVIFSNSTRDSRFVFLCSYTLVAETVYPTICVIYHNI